MNKSATRPVGRRLPKSATRKTRVPDGVTAAMLRGTEVDAALQQSGREALLLHSRLGHKVPVLRDGRTVLVPAAELLAELDSKTSRPSR